MSIFLVPVHEAPLQICRHLLVRCRGLPWRHLPHALPIRLLHPKVARPAVRRRTQQSAAGADSPFEQRQQGDFRDTQNSTQGQQRHCPAVGHRRKRAGDPPQTGEALAEVQTFTYRVLDEHSSVDPQVVEDVTGAEVVRDLFEGLMNQDATGELVPGVATGFDVSEDGLTYTFTLRDNARWSNGDPVLASDFVYAWKRAVDPALASEYAWFMELMSIENAAAIIAGEMDKDALASQPPMTAPLL